MQQDVQHLNGTVEAVTFQNEENGFAVLTLSDQEGELVCVVGPLAGSVPGEELTLAGRFITHAVYGTQFEATACVFRLPENEGAILKYLSSGVLPGIGPVTARRIVQRFGERALEVVANQPEMLSEIKGLSLAKARLASQKFEELFGIREALAALSAFGLSASEALPIYRMYQGQTLSMIQQNPYVLCGPPLYMNFARVDAIAESLAIDQQSNQRIQAAVLYTLRHNQQNGHTCLPKDKLLQTASRFFNIQPEALDDCILQMANASEIGLVEQREQQFVYAPEMLRAEMTAAMRIREMVGIPEHSQNGLQKQIEMLQTLHGIEYEENQKKAIMEALSRHILVITGGPGTGKTTTVNAILALYEQRADRVLLAAPTGRAAKRLSELTGRTATTIHRMLEVDFSQSNEYPRFIRNNNNPLRCDVLVVDEMSMVDAMLFQSMLDALKPSSRLILVGDSDQLPSVGPGNVLKGILDSGVVPVVGLTRIFRQAAQSLIVSNAHQIVEGKMPRKGTKQDDFFFIKAYGTSCQTLVSNLVCDRLPASYGFSSFADIQVLCPARKGPLGTEALNQRLQAELNPAGSKKPELRWGGTTFRMGDKVMQVKNNYDLPFTRTDGEPGAGAYNGDIGVIEEINTSAATLTVFCEDRHLYYTYDNLNELELAYAVTIHKSQGSEFPAVVIPVSEVPSKLRYRNLLYTGVTRGRRLCVLVGEQEILEQMVRNGRRNLRYSGFSGFLQDEDWI